MFGKKIRFKKLKSFYGVQKPFNRADLGGVHRIRATPRFCGVVIKRCEDVLMKVKNALSKLLIISALMLVGCSAPASPTRLTSQDSVCSAIPRVNPEYVLSPRVTFALAADYGQTQVVITNCLLGEHGYTQQWSAPGFIGSAGFAVPGPVYVNSMQTPTGSYSVTESFGRANPGTSLPYQQLKVNSYWGGHDDENFNKYFLGEGSYPDEHLWDFMQAGDYEQAAVLNYNRAPDAQAVHGQTFAIFLHAGLSETWGCISTDLETVNRYLQEVSEGERIIMGVSSEIFSPAV